MFYLDFSVPYQMLFQDSATPMMNGIIDLHHYIMIFLNFILIFVMVALFIIVKTFIYQYDVKYIESDIVENKSLIRKNRRHIYRFYSKKTPVKFFERKVGIKTYWNSFWNGLILAGKNNFYVKSLRSPEIFEIKPFLFEPFNNKSVVYEPKYQTSIRSKLQKKIKISWVIPTNIVSKYAMVLVQEDSNKEVNSIGAAAPLSSFIVGLYSKFHSYNKEFPDILHARAKNALGRRFVPEKSRHKFIKVILGYTDTELAAIYNPYNLNFFYWLQTYATVRSGLYKFTHSTVIEVVWTILPSLVLVFIGIPSFILLYAMDEIIEPDFIIKCIGHQWYWSYEVEYPDILMAENDKTALMLDGEEALLKEKAVSLLFILHTITEDHDFVANVSKLLTGLAKDTALSLSESITNIASSFEELSATNSTFSNQAVDNQDVSANDLNLRWAYSTFSSYMINEDDLEFGKPRLLEVDNPLYVPIETHIDLLITSNDVLHSWGVPSFGVKCDAVPGRLNHANLFIERPGVFYGQCSELCGVNHGFMPIKVVGITLEEFFSQALKSA